MNLKKKLAAGEFAVLAEMHTPKGITLVLILFRSSAFSTLINLRGGWKEFVLVDYIKNVIS